MHGLTTVRSGGKTVECMLKDQFDEYQNTHTGTDYFVKATATSYCLLVDLCCATFIACVTTILILTDSGSFLTYTIIVCGNIQFLFCGIVVLVKN